MALNLPTPSSQYDATNEANARNQIERADALNQKKGQDVVIKNNRLILTSPNGTQWSGTISNAGVVTWTAL